MKELIIDNSCDFNWSPKVSVDGNLDYERISVREDDGTIHVIYVGDNWDEKVWKSMLSNYNKKSHPTAINLTDLADTETPAPEAGIWKLISPSGKAYCEVSPIKCVSKEMKERVPEKVAMARILRGLFFNPCDMCETWSKECWKTCHELKLLKDVVERLRL